LRTKVSLTRAGSAVDVHDDSMCLLHITICLTQRVLFLLPSYRCLIKSSLSYNSQYARVSDQYIYQLPTKFFKSRATAQVLRGAIGSAPDCYHNSRSGGWKSEPSWGRTFRGEHLFFAPCGSLCRLAFTWDCIVYNAPVKRSCLALTCMIHS
jgi:hypothetical protein